MRKSGAKRSPAKKSVKSVKHASLSLFVGQTMRRSVPGSSSVPWTIAAPASPNAATSRPTFSKVQAGAPLPPLKRLQTSWCGSTTTATPKAPAVSTTPSTYAT